jgi:hypothetical protein
MQHDPDGWDMDRYLKLHMDLFLRGLAKEPDTETATDEA